MPTYVVLIHSDPNNMNSIVYHLIIVRYSMKTLHWYFPWATALHLYNMTGRGGKLQQLHCYHPFSDSLDIYLTKNHYENYSPKMVPIAKIWGPGSWTIIKVLVTKMKKYLRLIMTRSNFSGQKLSDDIICLVCLNANSDDKAVTMTKLSFQCWAAGQVRSDQILQREY